MKTTFGSLLFAPPCETLSHHMFLVVATVNKTRELIKKLVFFFFFKKTVGSFSAIKDSNQLQRHPFPHEGMPLVVEY